MLTEWGLPQPPFQCYDSPMELRDVEAKVLSAIGLFSDRPLVELARASKLRTHVFRHALDSLFERQMLNRRVIINPCRLGYSIYGLWFSLKPRAGRVHRQLVSHLVASPLVGYVGEFEGEYAYKIDVYCRSAAGFSDFLGEISEKFGDIFAKREMACSISIWDYALKFLAPDKPRPICLGIGFEEETIEVEPRDHEILRMLSVINNESHTSLARRLGIAPTTLEYRIKRLREERVIIGYHIVPEVERMRGMGLSMHVHRIKLTRLDRHTRERVLAFAISDPAVYTCTQSVGAFDAELCSAGDSKRTERDFCARLEDALGDFLQEHTGVTILKHYKVNNYPFASKTAPAAAAHKARRGK